MASNTTSRIPGAAIIVAALLVFALLIIATRMLWPDFMGAVTKTTTTTIHGKQPEEAGVREVDTMVERQHITFWHIVGTVLIPVTGGLLIGWAGFKFNQRQREREEAVENKQAQDNAIQAYLDQMSDLLVDRHLRSLPKGSDIHRLAEARTLEVLLGLDGERKRRPLKLVYGLGLIKNRLHTSERDEALLDVENLSLNNPNIGERWGSIRSSEPEPRSCGPHGT